MTKQNEQEALGTAMNKTEMFFEKNSKSMIIALLALFVLAAAIFGYRQLISQPRERKAAEMIAQAQYRFESTTPEYQLALEGDANGPGFLDVIDQYGSTRAGNLAKHYAGICYLRLGDLDNAAGQRHSRRDRQCPEHRSAGRYRRREGRLCRSDQTVREGSQGFGQQPDGPDVPA